MKRWITVFLGALWVLPSTAFGAIGFEAAVVVCRATVPGQHLLAMRERLRNGVWVYECDLVDAPPSAFTTVTIDRDLGEVLDVAGIAIPPDEYWPTQQAVQRLNYARTDFADAIATANAAAARTDLERIDLLYEAGVLAFRAKYFGAAAVVEVDSITGGVIPFIVPGLGIEPTLTVAEVAGAIAHAEWLAGTQWKAIEASVFQRFDGLTVKVLLAHRVSGLLMRPEIVQGFYLPAPVFEPIGAQTIRAGAVSPSGGVQCDPVSALAAVESASPAIGVSLISLEPFEPGSATAGFRWVVQHVADPDVERDAWIDAASAPTRKSPQFVAPVDFAPGDTNRDGVVDARDLAEILSSWGALNPLLDLNESGAVEAGDLAIVLGGWTI
ncbi:MAG: hypothetical protein RL136_1222 [Planctomycetota bacterium]